MKALNKMYVKKVQLKEMNFDEVERKRLESQYQLSYLQKNRKYEKIYNRERQTDREEDNREKDREREMKETNMMQENNKKTKQNKNTKNPRLHS